MRILAVDPGSKNLGIALSDPSGTIANPLQVLKHVSRAVNASAILDLANQHAAEMILIGQSLDENGQPTFEGRRAARLAAEIQSQTNLQILLWDESFSTLAARDAQIALGTPRRKRKGHLDDLAATVILQSYLDAQADQR
ncbi:MAG: Holliday junction resolvase RuvX [Anaerolineales bacterium]|jgi:putative Holliday junction resolvase